MLFRSGYPGYDASRWELAADANKAVLDWAQNESGWCRLYDTPDDPVDRYEEIFVNPAVPEIILDAGLMGTTTNGYFCRFMLPGQIMGAHDVPVNHAVTFNFTKQYQKKDGTDQVWDEVEGQSYPYEQYQAKLGELDPRFHASAFISGSEWSRGSGTVYHFYENNNLYLKGVPGVGFLRKFCKGVKNGSAPAPRWITFRLAEFYLNYAEAKAEIGTLTQDDINMTIKKLRDRVGMPNLDMDGANSDPDPYLSAAETGYPNVSGANKGVILEIRRERSIELLQEGHRYYDIIRWKEGKTFTQQGRDPLDQGSAGDGGRPGHLPFGRQLRLYRAPQGQ